jgi:hypothetical protein
MTQSATAVEPLPLATWTHLSVTYDGSSLRLFVNGVNVTTLPVVGAIAVTANPLRIGGNAIWGQYFAGLIDEVRIYNYALSEAAISRDMTIPVDNGLVAAYSFDEGTGTVLGDASGHGNHGTIDGATWTNEGRFGGALAFDGVDDAVAVSDASTLDLTTSFTLEAWVYPTALSGWRTVVLKEVDQGLAYSLYANDNVPRPAGYAKVAGVDQAAVGAASLALNTWTHLAATYDDRVLRLFVNGLEVGNLPLTGAAAVSDRPLRIGGNNIWGEYFEGSIDEVRIYNRPLSAQEIQTDMSTPIGGR